MRWPLYSRSLFLFRAIAAELETLLRRPIVGLSLSPSSAAHAILVQRALLCQVSVLAALSRTRKHQFLRNPDDLYHDFTGKNFSSCFELENFK